MIDEDIDQLGTFFTVIHEKYSSSSLIMLIMFDRLILNNIKLKEKYCMLQYFYIEQLNLYFVTLHSKENIKMI